MRRGWGEDEERVGRGWGEDEVRWEAGLKSSCLLQARKGAAPSRGCRLWWGGWCGGFCRPFVPVYSMPLPCVCTIGPAAPAKAGQPSRLQAMKVVVLTKA
jgi:hypothetical protein